MRQIAFIRISAEMPDGRASQYSFAGISSPGAESDSLSFFELQVLLPVAIAERFSVSLAHPSNFCVPSTREVAFAAAETEFFAMELSFPLETAELMGGAIAKSSWRTIFEQEVSQATGIPMGAIPSDRFDVIRLFDRLGSDSSADLHQIISYLESRRMMDSVSRKASRHSARRGV